MPKAQMIPKFLSHVCALGLAVVSPVYADCSAYLGVATINEINKEKANGNDNAADFVELKLLDTSIPLSVYGQWELTIVENGGQGPVTYRVSDFDDTSPPWLVQQGNDVASFIDLDAGMNLILKDASGDVIDYLDYDTGDGFAPLFDASCTAFVYDTTVASSSGGVKRIRRQPDGTGDWDRVNAQSIDPTNDTTNDDVPSGAPDASVSNIEVGGGNDAVFTVTLSAASGSDVVINYQTQNGTATAGSDYVAKSGIVTIPAGQTSASFTVTTLGSAAAGEKFNVVLSSSDAVVLTSIATATFIASVNSLDHFLLSHDNNGINCLAETISLSAIDSGGNVLTTYGEQVTLDTQSGKGSWSLVTGSGTFVDATANDGLATYTFDAADNGSVSFSLSYTEGTDTLDIDAFQTSDPVLRDDDTEGDLVFAPSGFTLTQNLLSNPPPASINDPLTTQIAGSGFAVHITAFGQTPTDPQCGVIESYTGNKDLAFWFDYDNPTSGSLSPSINGTGIAINEAGASTQVVTFTNGQAVVTMKYKDVGLIQLQVKDDVISGASNPFVVKPADLVITDIETLAGVNNPAASTSTGPGFVAAGESFRVVVQARDAEGDLTPNFGNESSGEGIRISVAGLVLPPSGNSGTISNADGFTATATAGEFAGTAFSWDEYGIMQLQASIADGDYLGAGNVTGTATGNVGRFFPARFSLVSGTVLPACNGFVYMDQPGLALSYELQAQGTAGNPLTNYSVATLGVSGVATPLLRAENADSGTNLASRLTLGSGNWVNGRYSVSVMNGVFARTASPDGAFEALQLGMSITDPIDGLGINDPDSNALTTGDCVAAGNCDAKSLGANFAVRYGRLEVPDSFGPETQNLEVAVTVSYWDGSGFVRNTGDICTTYSTAGITLSNYQDGLPTVSAISPTAITPVVNGASAPGSGILMSVPGAGNTGSVDLTYTGAATWLLFDWNGTGDEAPTGTLIFGTYRGHDAIIYWREVIN